MSSAFEGIYPVRRGRQGTGPSGPHRLPAALVLIAVVHRVRWKRKGVVRTSRNRNHWFTSQWFAWWYFSISAGFLLLAIRYYLLGEKPWLVALRVVISTAFAVLGLLQLRRRGSSH